MYRNLGYETNKGKLSELSPASEEELFNSCRQFRDVG